MSTGLSVFDTTVQETNLWLKALMGHLHRDDRHLAYLALRGVLHALRDAGAARATAVLPDLAYARKDRRTQLHDPITTRYVAQLIEAVGIDRMVVLDVHNLAAFDNAFRCPTVPLEARPLFVAHLTPLLRGRAVAVVSPVAGGVKRATELRETLAEPLGGEVPLAFLEKRRAGGVVSGDEAVVGAVARQGKPGENDRKDPWGAR